MKLFRSYQPRKNSINKTTKEVFALLIVGFFEVLFVRGFLTEILPGFKTRNWEETDCKILQFETIYLRDTYKKDPLIDISIKYEYFINDKPHTNLIYLTNLLAIPRNLHGIPLYAKAHPTVCYVNPDNPSHSVLSKGSYYDLLFLLLLLLPVAFYILWKLNYIEFRS